MPPHQLIMDREFVAEERGGGKGEGGGRAGET